MTFYFKNIVYLFLSAVVNVSSYKNTKLCIEGDKKWTINPKNFTATALGESSENNHAFDNFIFIVTFPHWSKIDAFFNKIDWAITSLTLDRPTDFIYVSIKLDWVEITEELSRSLSLMSSKSFCVRSWGGNDVTWTRFSRRDSFTANQPSLTSYCRSAVSFFSSLRGCGKQQQPLQLNIKIKIK